MERKFEIVERPTGSSNDRRGRVLSLLTAAIIETATTGQAVRILLNGDTQQSSFSGGMSKPIRARGLRTRTRKDGDYLYIWAEQREPPDSAV